MKTCRVCDCEVTVADIQDYSIYDYNWPVCSKHKHLRHVFNLEAYKAKYGSLEFVAEESFIIYDMNGFVKDLCNSFNIDIPHNKIIEFMKQYIH